MPTPDDLDRAARGRQQVYPGLLKDGQHGTSAARADQPASHCPSA